MAKEQAIKQKDGGFVRFAKTIERIGNKLPHPFYLFMILIVIVLAASMICSKLGVSVTYLAASRTGEVAEQTVSVVNMLSKEELQKWLANFVVAFTNSPNLTSVLIITMCVAICDQSDFFKVGLRKLLYNAPDSMVTFVLALVSVCANICSDGGVILMVTLGAVVFKSLGRNPWIGIIVAYGASNAGYIGNLLPSVGDVVVSTITSGVSEPLGYPVGPMANYIFQFVGTFILAFVTTIITEKVLVPLYGDTANRELGKTDRSALSLTPEENRGMKFAGYGMLGFVAVMLVFCVPKNGFLCAANGTLVPSSPLMSSLVPIISAMFVVLGICYGIGSGTIQSKNDVPKMMANGVKGIASMILILFVVAEMLYLFNGSNLATVISVSGERFLSSINFTGLPLMLAFILVIAFTNLFMYSATAKWMILAPIFVPMFLNMGISPEVTQCLYRIGDSITNNLTPLNAGLIFAITMMNENRIPSINKEEAGIGTLLSGQFVFSLVYMVTLIAMFCVFYFTKLPLGL